MSNVPFEIKCCNKVYNAKRYRVKPIYANIKKEEFKRIVCPQCCSIILEYERHYIMEDGEIKIVRRRLTNREAINYYSQFDGVHELTNTYVEKGAESLSNWFYGRNNKTYDMNDKRRCQNKN